MTRKIIAALIAALGFAAGSQSIQAQDYPARPVRVVVPFAAGGGTDLVGRIVAQELTKRLGQQFYIENKPGAAAADRDRSCRQIAGRWLHAAMDRHRWAVRAARGESLGALQDSGRLRLHRRRPDGAVRGDGQRQAAREVDGGIDCLRQSQSGQAEFRQCRHRQRAAYGHCFDERGGGHQHGSCPLQRTGADDHRADRGHGRHWSG